MLSKQKYCYFKSNICNNGTPNNICKEMRTHNHPTKCNYASKKNKKDYNLKKDITDSSNLLREDMITQAIGFLFEVFLNLF